MPVQLPSLSNQWAGYGSFASRASSANLRSRACFTSPPPLPPLLAAACVGALQVTHGEWAEGATRGTRSESRLTLAPGPRRACTHLTRLACLIAA